MFSRLVPSGLSVKGRLILQAGEKVCTVCLTFSSGFRSNREKATDNLFLPSFSSLLCPATPSFYPLSNSQAVLSSVLLLLLILSSLPPSLPHPSFLSATDRLRSHESVCGEKSLGCNSDAHTSPSVKHPVLLFTFVFFFFLLGLASLL